MWVLSKRLIVLARDKGVVIRAVESLNNLYHAQFKRHILLVPV